MSFVYSVDSFKWAQRDASPQLSFKHLSYSDFVERLFEPIPKILSTLFLAMEDPIPKAKPSATDDKRVGGEGSLFDVVAGSLFDVVAGSRFDVVAGSPFDDLPSIGLLTDRAVGILLLILSNCFKLFLRTPPV